MTLERSMVKYITENHSHSTCVQLLIQAGADVNMAANQDFTPLKNTALNDHDDCIHLLIQAGASIAPIIETALCGTPKCLQKLISAMILAARCIFNIWVQSSELGVRTRIAAVWYLKVVHNLSNKLVSNVSRLVVVKQM